MEWDILCFSNDQLHDIFLRTYNTRILAILPGYCKIGTYPYRIVSKNMIIMCKSCFLPYPKERNWGEGGGHPRPLPTPNFFEKKTDVFCIYGPLRFFFLKKENTKWPPTKENFLGPPLQTSGISLPYTVVS